MLPFGQMPRPSFDDEERKEIGKAVAIAALCALATKTVEVAADEFKAWLAARREAAKPKAES